MLIICHQHLGSTGLSIRKSINLILCEEEMPAGYNRLFAEREQVDFNITALYFLP